MTLNFNFKHRKGFNIMLVIENKLSKKELIIENERLLRINDSLKKLIELNENSLIETVNELKKKIDYNYLSNNGIKKELDILYYYLSLTTTINNLEKDL